MEFDASDPAIRGIALDPPFALGQSHRTSVPAKEAIGNRIGLRLGVRHRQKSVRRTRDAGHVRRLARTILRTPPPGAIPYRQASNSDGFPVQHNLSADAPDLIEMV